MGASIAAAVVGGVVSAGVGALANSMTSGSASDSYNQWASMMNPSEPQKQQLISEITPEIQSEYDAAQGQVEPVYNQAITNVNAAYGQGLTSAENAYTTGIGTIDQQFNTSNKSLTNNLAARGLGGGALAAGLSDNTRAEQGLFAANDISKSNALANLSAQKATGIASAENSKANSLAQLSTQEAQALGQMETNVEETGFGVAPSTPPPVDPGAGAYMMNSLGNMGQYLSGQSLPNSFLNSGSYYSGGYPGYSEGALTYNPDTSNLFNTTVSPSDYSAGTSDYYSGWTGDSVSSF